MPSKSPSKYIKKAYQNAVHKLKTSVNKKMLGQTVDELDNYYTKKFTDITPEEFLYSLLDEYYKNIPEKDLSVASILLNARLQITTIHSPIYIILSNLKNNLEDSLENGMLSAEKLVNLPDKLKKSISDIIKKVVNILSNVLSKTHCNYARVNEANKRSVNEPISILDDIENPLIEVFKILFSAPSHLIKELDNKDEIASRKARILYEEIMKIVFIRYASPWGIQISIKMRSYDEVKIIIEDLINFVLSQAIGSFTGDFLMNVLPADVIVRNIFDNSNSSNFTETLLINILNKYGILSEGIAELRKETSSLSKSQNRIVHIMENFIENKNKYIEEMHPNKYRNIEEGCEKMGRKGDKEYETCKEKNEGSYTKYLTVKENITDMDKTTDPKYSTIIEQAKRGSFLALLFATSQINCDNNSKEEGIVKLLTDYKTILNNIKTIAPINTDIHDYKSLNLTISNLLPIITKIINGFTSEGTLNKVIRIAIRKIRPIINRIRPGLCNPGCIDQIIKEIPKSRFGENNNQYFGRILSMMPFITGWSIQPKLWYNDIEDINVYNKRVNSLSEDKTLYRQYLEGTNENNDRVWFMDNNLSSYHLYTNNKYSLSKYIDIDQKTLTAKRPVTKAGWIQNTVYWELIIPTYDINDKFDEELGTLVKPNTSEVVYAKSANIVKFQSVSQLSFDGYVAEEDENDSYNINMQVTISWDIVNYLEPDEIEKIKKSIYQSLNLDSPDSILNFHVGKKTEDRRNLGTYMLEQVSICEVSFIINIKDLISKSQLEKDIGYDENDYSQILKDLILKNFTKKLHDNKYQLVSDIDVKVKEYTGTINIVAEVSLEDEIDDEIEDEIEKLNPGESCSKPIKYVYYYCNDIFSFKTSREDDVQDVDITIIIAMFNSEVFNGNFFRKSTNKLSERLCPGDHPSSAPKNQMCDWFEYIMRIPYRLDDDTLYYLNLLFPYKDIIPFLIELDKNTYQLKDFTLFKKYLKEKIISENGITIQPILKEFYDLKTWFKLHEQYENIDIEDKKVSEDDKKLHLIYNTKKERMQAIIKEGNIKPKIIPERLELDPEFNTFIVPENKLLADNNIYLNYIQIDKVTLEPWITIKRGGAEINDVYNAIKDPTTGADISIFSEKGLLIIHNYIEKLNNN